MDEERSAAMKNLKKPPIDLIDSNGAQQLRVGIGLAAGKPLAFGFGTCAAFFYRLRFFARCRSNHRTGLQWD